MKIINCPAIIHVTPTPVFHCVLFMSLTVCLWRGPYPFTLRKWESLEEQTQKMPVPQHGFLQLVPNRQLILSNVCPGSSSHSTPCSLLCACSCSTYVCYIISYWLVQDNLSGALFQFQSLYVRFPWLLRTSARCFFTELWGPMFSPMSHIFWTTIFIKVTKCKSGKRHKCHKERPAWQNWMWKAGTWTEETSTLPETGPLQELNKARWANKHTQLTNSRLQPQKWKDNPLIPSCLTKAKCTAF